MVAKAAPDDKTCRTCGEREACVRWRKIGESVQRWNCLPCFLASDGKAAAAQLLRPASR